MEPGPILGAESAHLDCLFILGGGTAKKFAELQGRKEKDTPSRKEKPPREEKEKEKEKPPPAPREERGRRGGGDEEEEELDEADQALAAEPRPRDPFAHLPKR